MGSLCGFVMPLFFIKDHKKYDDLDEWPEEVRKEEISNVWTYIFWQNVVITILALPIVIAIWKPKPTHPPNKEAKDRAENVKLQGELTMW